MRLGLGADAFQDSMGTVGLVEDEQILAAVVYHGYNEFSTGRKSCWASIASLPHSNWCTRRYLKAILTYPFEGLGVCVLQVMTARANKDARRFNEKLGFKRVGPARRGFDGRQDAILYDMLPHEAAKWLGYEPTAWKESVKDGRNIRRR